jgi:hypothetical protein
MFPSWQAWHMATDQLEKLPQLTVKVWTTTKSKHRIKSRMGPMVSIVLLRWLTLKGSKKFRSLTSSTLLYNVILTHWLRIRAVAMLRARPGLFILSLFYLYLFLIILFSSLYERWMGRSPIASYRWTWWSLRSHWLKSPTALEGLREHTSNQ